MNIIKTFNTFEEGIKDLKNIIPEVADLVGDEIKEEKVILNMIENIKRNIPSIYNPAYPATTAFSINAKEVGFKTPGYIAFGWRIHTDDDKVSYGFRVTIVQRNKFAKTPPVVEDLLANGWQKISHNHQAEVQESVAS